MGYSRAYTFIEDRIIYVHSVGELTPDNLIRVNAEVIALLQKARANGAGRINVVIDFSMMTGLHYINPTGDGNQLTYFNEPNCGWTMIVGQNINPFLLILSHLFQLAMSKKLYMVDRMDQAMNRIQRLEPDIETLPNLDQWKSANLMAVART